MSKKIYAAPTITDHGNAVEQTKGLSGRCWEIAGKCYEYQPNDNQVFRAEDETR